MYGLNNIFSDNTISVKYISVDCSMGSLLGGGGFVSSESLGKT